jgi:uncharacterized repeat protein (TIGR01451 family)
LILKPLAMKKNYLSAFFVVLFGLFFSVPSFAQLQAHDDSGSVANTSNTTVVIQDVLANDTLNNVPVAFAQVHFVSISSSSENLNIDTATGSVIFSGGPIAMGNYDISYVIDTPGPPYSLSMAVVHVTVGCDPIPAPVMASIVQPTCANPAGSITMTWTPGPWLLEFSYDGIPVQVVAGNGTATIPVATGASVYDFWLASDSSECISPHVMVPIDPTLGIRLNMAGTYFDLNANGLTDVGDIINYTFPVTNYGCDAVINVHALHIAGGLTVNGTISSLDPGATDSTSLTANAYAITQSDINQGYVTKFVAAVGINGGGEVITQGAAYTSLNISDGIKLIAFIDTNGNGVKDGSESNFNNGSFKYTINGEPTVHYTSSSQQPFYLFENNPATSYDLSFIVNTDLQAYYTTSASYTDVTVANGSGVTAYYFPITAVPYIDLSVQLVNYNAPPRPGFIYYNYLYYRNNGNLPIASGTVTFNKDNVLDITAISQSGTVATPTGFTYAFTNLLPNELRYIMVLMHVPTIPTVALGDFVTNTALASVPSGDVNTANNTSELTQTIVGSYDPNEKSESHGGRILYSGFTANDYLTYTIQFENTGTANAVTVNVVDVLDAKLDEFSVRMVDASHAYVLDRVGSTLTWHFDGIDLPPSEPDSTIGHGYVTFQVKPKPGFALGDIIPNIASIYFDFNPAIVTNPCPTSFVNSLATDQFAFDQFKYYPNPVKNTLTVSNASLIDTIVVTSVLGQQISTTKVNGLHAEIDLSGLSNGVYFVKAAAGNQQKTFKIIKE